MTFEPSAARIASASRVLAAGCLLAVVLLPVAVCVYGLVADASQLAMRAGLPADAVQVPLAQWQRLSLVVVVLLGLAPLLLGLWKARSCFAMFAAGRVFAADAARALRAFAGWMAVSVATGVVAGSAVSVLLTLPNAPGQRHLAVAFGSDQALMLLFAGMVWVMAAVIAQATGIADENAQFV